MKKNKILNLLRQRQAVLKKEVEINNKLEMEFLKLIKEIKTR